MITPASLLPGGTLFVKLRVKIKLLGGGQVQYTFGNGGRDMQRRKPRVNNNFW
jgi:hypothetical protein